jgi:hypothetical protein
MCAAEAFGKETLNPIVTFGPGIIGEDGPVFVYRTADGGAGCEDVSDTAAKAGLETGPFV